jgi:hypothetical protein
MIVQLLVSLLDSRESEAPESRALGAKDEAIEQVGALALEVHHATAR